ncbi:MAG TPA: nucleotidyltransferase family protein, partial [Candidatus Sulfotelmatobacter sp.]|nr:nucleotidyltransferase family protein [Candidatus Sulfotelmatobacter sp.]
MAELLSPQRLSDTRAFEREWTALRECVSPWSDKERLHQCLTGVDWPRLLVLARGHGVVGQLAARLHKLDAPVIPSEIKEALLERQREQNFLTLRLTAELFRLLELFSRNEIR